MTQTEAGVPEPRHWSATAEDQREELVVSGGEDASKKQTES